MTGADGRYTIADVPAGTYLKVSAGGGGWEGAGRVAVGERRRDAHVRPGRAARLGGDQGRGDDHLLQRQRVRGVRLRPQRRRRPVPEHRLVDQRGQRQVPGRQAAGHGRRHPVRDRPDRDVRRPFGDGDRRLPRRDLARRHDLDGRAHRHVHHREPPHDEPADTDGGRDRRPLRPPDAVDLAGRGRAVPRPLGVRDLRQRRPSPTRSSSPAWPAVRVLLRRAGGDVRVPHRRGRVRARARPRSTRARCPTASTPSPSRAVGDPTPATRTFTTGETGPRVIDLAGPPERSNDTTPTFTFAADEAGATFECGLEAPGIPGTFAPCTTPWTYPALADARYTLTVRARDADGNVGPDATWTFTLDATAARHVPRPRPARDRALRPAGLRRPRQRRDGRVRARRRRVRVVRGGHPGRLAGARRARLPRPRRGRRRQHRPVAGRVPLHGRQRRADRHARARHRDPARRRSPRARRSPPPTPTRTG